MNKYFDRKFIVIFCFSLLFICAFSLGWIIDKYGQLNTTIINIFLWIFIVLILSFGVSLFLKKLIEIIYNKIDLKKGYYNKNTFMYVFIINLLSYIPVFFAYFPSIWTYDITTQVDQIFNSGYTRYHPLLHTFLIDVCLNLGKTIFDDYTYGAMIYSVIQMIFMSLCIAYAFNYVCKKKNVSLKLQIILLLFIVLIPYNPIMVLSTTKDTIFSGLTLILIVKLYDIINFGYGKKKIITFIILVILWFSFRNNAYFAYIAFTIIALCLFWNKKIIIISMTIMIIILNLGFNTLLDIAFNAQTISSAEIISVPGSQIARSALYSSENITDEQWDKIEVLFGDSYHYYNPYLFDDVKTKMNFSASQLPELLRLWFELLPNCLDEYIDAFLCLNIGSWYPLDKTYTRIYIDNYYDGEYIEGSLDGRHQGYLQTLPSNVIEEIRFETYLPSVYNYYENICSLNIGNNFVLTQLLLSPASYLWIIIALIFYCIYKKDKKKVLPLILLVLYWGTSLLGPCTLFRYMYPIVLSTPFCIVLVLMGEMNIYVKKV